MAIQRLQRQAQLLGGVLQGGGGDQYLQNLPLPLREMLPDGGAAGGVFGAERRRGGGGTGQGPQGGEVGPPGDQGDGDQADSGLRRGVEDGPLPRPFQELRGRVEMPEAVPW